MRLCRGRMQPCSCIPTKQWFPHASVPIITCCTQRNQALLWTSVPQTHRWGCYYSSLLEFSGKEGLALWHTSCPLKSLIERWLSRPSFQTPALMAAWKETLGGLRQSSISWTSCNQCTNQANISCYYPRLDLCVQLYLLRFFLKTFQLLSRSFELFQFKTRWGQTSKISLKGLLRGSLT